ncbi:MAG: helix-turn-helix protein [Candidatus Sumerlaeota bacterium]|nr:helix-turn-helix protein [Candidatus Sumerlaeota bacterium]
MNFFADALRKALKEKGLNQAQLAEFLGIEPPYISRWLRGAYPRLDLMQDVLARLDWQLDRAHPEYDPVIDAVKQVRSELDEATGDAVAESCGTDAEQVDFRKLLSNFVEIRQTELDSVPRIEGLIRFSQEDFEVVFERPSGYDLAKLESCIPRFANGGHRPLQALLLDRAATPFGSGDTILAFVREWHSGEEIPDGTEVIVQCPVNGLHYLRRFHSIDDVQGKKRTSFTVFVPLTGRGGLKLQKPGGAQITHLVEGWWKPSRAGLREC